MSSRIAKVIACAAVASGVIAAIGAIQSGRAAAGSLVAAYAFNEGAGTILQDSSGNGNAGTISGATWTSAGKFGGALVFNGTSARVTCAGFVVVASRLGDDVGGVGEPVVGVERVAGRDLQGRRQLLPDGDIGPQWRSGLAAAPSPAPTQTRSRRARCATNTWTYLATTYDGANLRLYVNGTQVATQARTGAITTSTNALTIGSDPHLRSVLPAA